ncbi:RNA polymerase factor sigma-54 [Leeia aquatica]|uniref:RNA polymerase sigma-54 factor n=1 Tax=Leeia aquatica TaxID=2725557 RepID=A0A847SHQ4_9NEIS|nr:RNA polymerase factor sigma-54 [Leeia aquatica]NLR76848.1 RNA polymerase factor sigma-54 [Leeia aquatica]
MKPTLQLKLSQQLTLTPQLQQAIRLLQLSTLDMQQELDQFIELNPMLERADGPDDVAEPVAEGDSVELNDAWQAAGEALGELSWAAAGNGSPDDEDEERDWMQQTPESISLREHLLAQLGEMKLPQRDAVLASLIVEALDEDGYLLGGLEELIDLGPDEWEVDEEEWRIALRYVQHCEPAGVAARALPECLQLQLLRLPDSDVRQMALTLVLDHLDLLGARDYTKLKKRLQCDEDMLRQVQQLIGSLDPKPGRPFSTEKPRYVVPDVVVVKQKGKWVAHLNADAVPKLKVNQLYASILTQHRGADGKGLQEQLQEARWMVKNVQQRFATILRVSRAIVERQWRFFEHGEVGMVPLVLREIADELDLHESTVSRVTNQKYLLSPRGIFELKYFFGSRLETDTGGACSATAIRALIKQLIQAEDPARPLSDSQLSDMLANQGVVVARRTVAKYREAMHIAPVNLRKAL